MSVGGTYRQIHPQWEPWPANLPRRDPTGVPGPSARSIGPAAPLPSRTESTATAPARPWTAAGLARLRLADIEPAFQVVAAVQRLDRRIRVGLLSHLDKPKAPTLASLPIVHDLSRHNLPERLEEFAEFCGADRETKVTDIEAFHHRDCLKQALPRDRPNEPRAARTWAKGFALEQAGLPRPTATIPTMLLTLEYKPEQGSLQRRTQDNRSQPQP